MLVTPPLFGLMFDLTGSYYMIFAVFIGPAALCQLAVPHIRLDARTPNLVVEEIARIG